MTTPLGTYRSNGPLMVPAKACSSILVRYQFLWRSLDKKWLTGFKQKPSKCSSDQLRLYYSHHRTFSVYFLWFSEWQLTLMHTYDIVLHKLFRLIRINRERSASELGRCQHQHPCDDLIGLLWGPERRCRCCRRGSESENEYHKYLISSLCRILDQWLTNVGKSSFSHNLSTWGNWI